jgi:RNA-dependent RNA polymerase
LELAALHSKAVDYVKTGEPAVMPRELRPRIWPHFMEKKHLPPDQIYVSKKVLGQLYDQVERVDFVPQFGSGFDSRVLDAYSPDDRLMADARALKAEYDADMRRIMAQHEIKTEFEVWSTFVLSHANMSRDYKFHEELGQIAFALKERYHTACEARAGGREFERLAPFVASMYRVTRDEVTAWLAASGGGDDDKDQRSHTPSHDASDDDASSRRRRQQQQAPLISFPWCFSEVLGRIALEHGDRATARDSEAFKAPVFTHSLGRPMKTDKAAAELANGAAGAPSVETSVGVSNLGELLELFHHEEAAANVDVQNTGDPSAPITANGEEHGRHAEDKGEADSDASSLYLSASEWEGSDGDGDCDNNDDIGEDKNEDKTDVDDADIDDDSDEYQSIGDDDGPGSDDPEEVVLEEKESGLEALEKLLRGDD